LFLFNFTESKQSCILCSQRRIIGIKLVIDLSVLASIAEMICPALLRYTSSARKRSGDKAAIPASVFCWRSANANYLHLALQLGKFHFN
jgi:hypothetical protein